MRLSPQYVWLVWAFISWLPWILFYALFPTLRKPMLWSSWAALLFGISEFLFFGIYWRPPTLFSLGERIHLDLESFLFLFAVGGIASVAYHVLTGRPIRAIGPTKKRQKQIYQLSLATPVLVFPFALIGSNRPILAAIIAMFSGVAARLLVRPDLWAKSFCGGIAFLIYYVFLLQLLVWSLPGFLARFWIASATLGHVGPFPAAELGFGAAFGSYWSGLYEHFRWTFEASPSLGHRVRNRDDSTQLR